MAIHTSARPQHEIVEQETSGVFKPRPTTFGAVFTDQDRANAPPGGVAETGSGTFTPADASVTTQLTNVLDTNSPLLTRARTQAAQESNRRGLLNSSIGVQAGEAAALDVGLDIASQQAGQIHESNLQGGQIASNELLAGNQITSTEGLAANQITADALLAGNQITADEAEQLRNIEAEQGLQAAQIAANELLADKEIAATGGLLTQQLASNEAVAAADLASKEAISQAGLDAQERIAASNVASSEKEKATAALAQFDKAYQESFRAISALEDIPADVREEYLTHILALRDANFELVEELYNIDLTWPTAGDPVTTTDGGGATGTTADGGGATGTTTGGGGTTGTTTNVFANSGIPEIDYARAAAILANGASTANQIAELTAIIAAPGASGAGGERKKEAARIALASLT